MPFHSFSYASHKNDQFRSLVKCRDDVININESEWDAFNAFELNSLKYSNICHQLNTKVQFCQIYSIKKWAAGNMCTKKTQNHACQTMHQECVIAIRECCMCCFKADKIYYSSLKKHKFIAIYSIPNTQSIGCRIIRPVHHSLYFSNEQKINENYLVIDAECASCFIVDFFVRACSCRLVAIRCQSFHMIHM